MNAFLSTTITSGCLVGAVWFGILDSAFSVASAIFLILELDRPFGGIIKIPSELLAHALIPLSK